MDLMENFRTKTAKSKVKGINNKAEFDVMYSTGFLSIDYLNGTTIYVESEERKFTYNSTGVVDGSANCIIGRSNSGKSTLLTQICANIVKPFPQSKLYIDDIESSLPMSRKEFLLDMTIEELESKVEIRNTGITTDNVFQRIKIIHDDKIDNRKEFEYDTGLYDTYGKRIFKLVPTVYVIDSLPFLLPEDLSDDGELGGNMDASSIAKKNTGLIKKIVQLCKEANIILFTINHIMDDIQMGFIPKAAQISGLKKGERLPGGKVALYVANNMFRVDDSITLKATEGFGIDGSIVTFTIIKSRTNATRRSVPLIFNKTEGRFDNILSLYQLLKEEGKISGAGAHLYLDGAPDVKFSQKTFKTILNGSPELQQIFAQECFNILSGYLSITRNVSKQESTTYNNICDIINGMSMREVS